MKTASPPPYVRAFRVAFGLRIKRARVARGMSQQELARGLCTQACLSNYERGRRDVPLVVAVALASSLGVRLQDLLAEEEAA